MKHKKMKLDFLEFVLSKNKSGRQLIKEYRDKGGKIKDKTAYDIIKLKNTSSNKKDILFNYYIDRRGIINTDIKEYNKMVKKTNNISNKKASEIINIKPIEYEKSSQKFLNKYNYKLQYSVNTSYGVESQYITITSNKELSRKDIINKAKKIYKLLQGQGHYNYNVDKNSFKLVKALIYNDN